MVPNGKTPFVSKLLDRVVFNDRVKGALYKRWYGYVNRTIGDDAVVFMNYGYAGENGDGPALSEADEPNRVYIQLYHAVAGAVDLEGCDVLEMSCGRGGGASYVSEYLKPRQMVGVDLTPSAVLFCDQYHGYSKLRFFPGDAHRFPFEHESFDAVINVEASHCYPDVPRFLAEVHRVLRPGGHFLYSDFRKAESCAAWRGQIAAAGLTIVEEEEITPHVVRGLERNHDQTSELIRRLAPRMLHGLFRQFAGTRGSLIYEDFRQGRSRYLRFVLRKS